jgi:hypothetical protein
LPVTLPFPWPCRIIIVHQPFPFRGKDRMGVGLLLGEAGVRVGPIKAGDTFRPFLFCAFPRLRLRLDAPNPGYRQCEIESRAGDGLRSADVRKGTSNKGSRGDHGCCPTFVKDSGYDADHIRLLRKNCTISPEDERCFYDPFALGIWRSGLTGDGNAGAEN